MNADENAGDARLRFLTGGFIGTALAVIGSITFSGKAIIVKLGFPQVPTRSRS